MVQRTRVQPPLAQVECPAQVVGLPELVGGGGGGQDCGSGLWSEVRCCWPCGLRVTGPGCFVDFGLRDWECESVLLVVVRRFLLVVGCCWPIVVDCGLGIACWDCGLWFTVRRGLRALGLRVGIAFCS